MPEIKIKHVVSFSSEDKVHKVENLLKDETYRKWKCATPGEKNATVVLQFEKAVKIHSIDIGNEGSAFVEVLVGRSSDSVSDYQVLLVASSFMSPLESRNGTHPNRVRMFGQEKLSQNTKDEKWDCVQVVCTQPFSKNMQYGLTFIKFHSPPEIIDEQSTTEKSVTRLGAFKLKEDDEDDDSLPSVSTWFGKPKIKASESSSGSSSEASPSYATVVLASNNNTSKITSVDSSLKRKADDNEDVSQEPPAKKTPLNKEHIVYKDVLRGSPERKKASDTSRIVKKDVPSPKVREKKKEPASPATSSNKQSPNSTPTRTLRQKIPFNKIFDRVIFALSGFVNPLRGDLRDKALEMGAKYRPDWDNSCTHLVCAFAKTPKYEQVKKVNGRVVTKEWILDCYSMKQPLLWRKYELSSGDSSDELDDSDEDPNFINDDDDDGDSDSDVHIIEDSETDDEKKTRKKPQKKNQRKKAANSAIKNKLRSPTVKNQTIKNAGKTSNSSLANTPTRKQSNISDSEDELNTPKKKEDSSIFNKLKGLQQQDKSNSPQSPNMQKVEDESETEDEDALQDYIANTDVEDDSDGDTEDEIRKVEERAQKNKVKMNGSKDVEIAEKPDVSDLPLPDLPNFFKKKRFFLYGGFLPSKQHELHRYITAYNGILEDYVNENVKYVITEKNWDDNFNAALGENEDLIFVKPTWIYKCHEAGKLVPYQPYIVIPDA